MIDDVAQQKIQEAYEKTILNEGIDPKHKKLLKDASQEMGMTEKEILAIWKKDKPHFGGSMSHRYDKGSKECSYCLRPKDF